MNEPEKEMASLHQEILDCMKCPRLAQYIREVAATRTRRFINESYHGRPLPGFGDIHAKLLIVGLAPAAHGGNRTGRMFTGDSSANWLTRIMYEYKFASITTSTNKSDGLLLRNVYVTAAARCAPPQNKPTTAELRNCLPFLKHEMAILSNVRLILCLGQIGYKAACQALRVKPTKFGHNILYEYDSTDIRVLTSYHPSRQNTQTGRLTWEAWDAVFAHALRIINEVSM
ncbi:MAG: uracil-DNA glycosylase [Cenarchaeum sp. SB0661_bin_35]|nr:uracil-DNA glycosylase [Cenarchaeum sp. SB0667_bin_13]MXZ93086.1 uracil-DNA glycosylase [Cenarchaeum sp. SB0666_bin_15]MYC79256.1 uracil-DNA glycosylase [Cenarchaeum sp. SB0661_bin_35]MYD59183.1 uracil-DNA glycosylase [Cenarchaeum sp. SB0678_bin_8]MYJ27572.1 uracil-DNA glycosylase [Cenarchaeum sp. SB0672_bin_9]